MKEKTCYFCEICNKSYMKKDQAETCEKLHRMPVSVSRAMSQEIKHYPYFVDVEFDDGKTLCYSMTQLSETELKEARY